MELDISDNPIGNEGIEIIGICINSPCMVTLRKLNLTNCRLDFNGMYNFFYTLQTNKRLEVLNLNKNNLFSEKFGQIKPIINIMGIKELRVEKCKIGNEGAIAFAEALSANNCLKLLDISDNKIDDKGFLHFKELPNQNYTLEVLEVAKNLISDLSARDFVRNLNKNSSIKKLNFFDNQLRNETGSALIDSLRFNKNILKITLKFNRIQSRILDEIKRLIKMNNDNSKQKYIPNLKREIRNNYVTENDFEITEAKIQETGSYIKNVKLIF